MLIRRVSTVLVSMLVALVLLAGSAFAHHCINPSKPSGKGVNYTVVGFDGNGAPIFEQTGPGKGIGGFATIFGADVHTIGNSSVRDEVGNPNMSAEQQCDGKGIDLLGCP